MELLACCVSALSAPARHTLCGRSPQHHVQAAAKYEIYHQATDFARSHSDFVTPLQADAIIANPVCYGHMHGKPHSLTLPGLVGEHRAYLLPTSMDLSHLLDP